MGLDSSPDQLIKTGVAALKRKDYVRAISIFQKVHQNEHLSAAYRLKAQMGLICTYEAQGAKDKAKDLCQLLLKSRSQSIRQWGQNKLQALTLEDSEEASKPRISQSVTDRYDMPASSGFVPLDATEVTEQSLPKRPDDGSKESLFDSDSPSMFHYQTLNSRQPSPDLPRTVESHEVMTDVVSEEVINDKASISDNNPSVVTQLAKDKKPENLPNQAVKHVRKSSTQPPPQDLNIWPVGERLHTLKPLPNKVNMGRLWLAQILTTILLFWVMRWLLQTTLFVIGSYVQFVANLLPFHLALSPIFWASHTWTIIFLLGGLALGSPWLWALVLKLNNPLPHEALKERLLSKYEMPKK
ncbi:MAG: hypothetical protein AAFY17_11290 [Cyanobacteria bacterium J06642_11]